MILNPSESDTSAAIEITPLIDMVFLLLIFFLVATTFHQTEREMQIALPAANATDPISSSLREIIINVDDEGTIFVNGQVIAADDLRALVTKAVASNPEQKVTVRGDRDAAYGHIVAVLDICKGSGIQEPYLDTVVSQ